MSNIKVIASRKQMSLTDLAAKLGMTYVGLSKLIRENSTTVTTLEKIAEALNVPIHFFFMSEEEMNGYKDFSLDKYQELLRENAALKKEINDLKDKIIRLADKIS